MIEDENLVMTAESGLLSDARKIIDAARANAVRSVDFNRVMMYWNLGKRIFEEEQHGKDRAEYGARIIRDLAVRLEAEYGSGFGVRQLDQSRKFYRLYPIAHTVCAQLDTGNRTCGSAPIGECQIRCRIPVPGALRVPG